MRVVKNTPDEEKVIPKELEILVAKIAHVVMIDQLEGRGTGYTALDIAEMARKYFNDHPNSLKPN